ncbi:hypothetical protein SFC43_05405 [Bacteroides sp. CR5/BHMF/2]|nr:hypothetical protein [Bacteroides sp. CR5/BHMF/2]
MQIADGLYCKTNLGQTAYDAEQGKYNFTTEVHGYRVCRYRNPDRSNRIAVLMGVERNGKVRTGNGHYKPTTPKKYMTRMT